MCTYKKKHAIICVVANPSGEGCGAPLKRRFRSNGHDFNDNSVCNSMEWTLCFDQTFLLQPHKRFACTTFLQKHLVSPEPLHPSRRSSWLPLYTLPDRFNMNASTSAHARNYPISQLPGSSATLKKSHIHRSRASGHLHVRHQNAENVIFVTLYGCWCRTTLEYFGKLLIYFSARQSLEFDPHPNNPASNSPADGNILLITEVWEERLDCYLK